MLRVRRRFTGRRRPCNRLRSGSCRALRSESEHHRRVHGTLARLLRQSRRNLWRTNDRGKVVGEHSSRRFGRLGRELQPGRFQIIGSLWTIFDRSAASFKAASLHQDLMHGSRRMAGGWTVVLAPYSPLLLLAEKETFESVEPPSAIAPVMLSSL